MYFLCGLVRPFKKRNLYLVTLSIGKHYTEKFANKLIYDVLNNSDLKIYITTDVPEIVEEHLLNVKTMITKYSEIS
jgi:hypothetical protein